MLRYYYLTPDSTTWPVTPVTAARLRGLVADGIITPDTLIRREDWNEPKPVSSFQRQKPDCAATAKTRRPDESQHVEEETSGVWGAAARGAIYCVVLSYLAAAVCAIFIGVPCPMAGMLRGVEGLVVSPFVVTLLGMSGGFLVLAGLGACVGAMIQAISGQSETQGRHIAVASFAFDLGLFVLLAGMC